MTKILNLDNLKQRRSQLCLRFAKQCLKNPKTREMFPLNADEDCNTRNREVFYVQPARTNRLRDSAIPQLQRALNLDLKR